MGKYEMLFDMNIAVQNLGGKILSFKRIPYLLQEKKYLKRNKELFRFKKSEICYILGLGPSLKEINLSKLKGDTIVTNRFYRYDLKKELEPNYYLMMDNAFFNSEETKCLSEAKKKYLKTAFVLNGKYRSESQKIVGMQNNYFMYSWDGLFSGQDLNIDAVLPVFGNVVCCAIGLALCLGYKKIILLGCDFNSFATQKVEHCYIEDKDAPKLRSLASELFIYSFEAEMHNRLAEYARAHGISIKNGTPTSLIDSYTFLSEREQSEISK